MSAQPPSGPPRPPAVGPSIGPPGGLFGPPGGLRPPPLAPIAPIPSVEPAGVALGGMPGGGAPGGGIPLPSLPGGAGPGGGAPVAAIPGGGAFGAFAGAPPGVPPPSAVAGGGVLPGAGQPIVLPDLQAVGRAAMADVLEGERAATTARDRVPDLIELATREREGSPSRAPARQAAGAGPAVVPAGEAARRIAELRARVRAREDTPRRTVIDVADEAREEVSSPASWLPPGGAPTPGPPPPRRPGPPPPRGPGPPPPPPPRAAWPAPANWAPPPPPPPRGRARARIDTSAWPGAEVVPRERDSAQRIADAAYPLYQRLTSNPAGIITAVLLFGLTVPVLILRQRWDLRWRIGLSLLVTYIWLSVVGNLF